MDQVAHQTIVMQFILELAKSLKIDPRGCFREFFQKIKVCVCVAFVHEKASIQSEARYCIQTETLQISAQVEMTFK